jgi:hypothetical protein
MALIVRTRFKEVERTHGHEDRDEKRGTGQASPQAAQVADNARRVLPLVHLRDKRQAEPVAQRCAKENVDHHGYLLQLSKLELIERNGDPPTRWPLTGGWQAETTQGGAIPRSQDARCLRLRRPTIYQQAAAHRSPSRRLPRQAREHPLHRWQRHRQDAHRHRPGNRRLSARKEGPLLSRDRTHHAVVSTILVIGREEGSGLKLFKNSAYFS